MDNNLLALIEKWKQLQFGAVPGTNPDQAQFSAQPATAQPAPAQPAPAQPAPAPQGSPPSDDSPATALSPVSIPPEVSKVVIQQSTKAPLMPDKLKDIYNRSSKIGLDTKQYNTPYSVPEDKQKLFSELSAKDPDIGLMAEYDYIKEIPANKRGIQHAQRMREIGMELAASADRAMAEKKKEVDQFTLNQLEAEQRETELDRGIAQRAADRKLQEYESLSNEVKQTQLEPGRKLRNMGTGQTIAMVLVSAIAGAAAGFRGKESNVMSVINDSINRDFQAQEQNLQNKRNALGEMGKQYSILAGKIKDVDERYMMFRNIQLQNAQLRLSQIADHAASEQSRAKYIEGIGLLEQDRLNTMQGLKEKAFNGELNKLKLQADVASTPTAIDVLAKPNEQAIKAAEAKVPGLYLIKGMTPTENDVKESQKIVAGYQPLRDVLQQMRDLRAENGNELWGEGKTQINTLANKAMNAIRMAEQMGTLDRGAMEAMPDFVKDPNYWNMSMGMGRDEMLDAIDAYIQMLDSGTKAKLRAYKHGLTSLSEDVQ